MNIVKWIDQRRHWWKVFLIICAVSIAVVGYIGVKTYEFAPPICDFVAEDGQTLFTAAEVTGGQGVFFRRGLMEYGSFLGDGGMRGPDFTAEALSLRARFMREHLDEEWRERIPDAEQRAVIVASLVEKELKRNRHEAASGGKAAGTVTVSRADAHAFQQLVRYYGEKFGSGGELAGNERFQPAGYITDPAEIRQLSAFFYWGAWLCAAERPGAGYSYTHNFRHLPQSTLRHLEKRRGERATFGLAESFLFLVGVNFWNFLGAGVLGFMINLPIVNYYQHGTYLTVNHGHAALMGVYGNLAIAAMLFCGRWNVGPSRWNAGLLRASFWSLNVGLMLMVFLDLFPVGVHQLVAVLDRGYAFARSQAYIQGSVFQALTWMRGIGVVVFVLGGVLPLVWFMVTRWFSLRPAQSAVEAAVVPPSVLAISMPAIVGERSGIARGV